MKKLPEDARRAAARNQVDPPQASTTGDRRRALPFPWDERPQPGPRSHTSPLIETHPDAQALWQHQKLESLGRLATGVANDFNNALLAIMGNADLLENSLAADENDRQLVAEIKHAASRAGDLCGQLLAFAGRGPRSVGPLDVSDSVRRMVRMLKVAMPARAALRLDLADDLPPVAADRSQFNQVVMNLAVNAAEAMGENGGTVSIATSLRDASACRFGHCVVAPRSTAGRFVTLTVTDSGPGMDPLTVARAFDPFYSTKPRGRGLGLASVLGIVRTHGGGVGVDTGPGEGTTITVLLPGRDAQAATTVRARGSVDAAPGGATVLVVDDEEYLRVLAARMLTRLGHEVHLAADGAEALVRCRELGERLDLVLLDLIMPGRDGAAVFDDLRRINPRVPVLLSSGYHEDEISRRFGDRGLAGFLQKPYVMEDLARTVDAVLARAGKADSPPG